MRLADRLAGLRASARRRPRLTIWLTALALGGALFFLWMGYARMLDVRDLAWIFHEDPFQHTIGWDRYRDAPLLQYPLTKNPQYGLELGSAIVFSDSIPIVALVLRPLSAILPRPMQYLGWWVLLSCVMQAYWSLRLVLLRTDRLRDAVIGSVFFLTTPVLLERFGGQTAVGSHWLVLWALWLYLVGRGARLGTWIGLLLLTVSVHAYLFAMVGAIWLAHLVACRMRGQLGRRELGLAAATLLIVIPWMHALGYFMTGGGAAAGAWRSNFDLLGFLEPAAGARQRWLPVIYNDPWDGCMYLGAGVVVLLVASAAAWFVLARRRSASGSLRDPAARPPWAPLLVIVLGLVVFAITDEVKLLNHPILHLPLPRALYGLYGAFRGAERMVWPAYYLTLLATVWLALRAWPVRAVSVVLAGAVLVQLYDVSPQAAIKHGEMRGGGLIRELADPIWKVIGDHYARIVSVPPKNRQPDWWVFAWFAARHGMGTDLAYLSRTDPVAQAEAEHRYVQALATGKLDPDTVYYLPGPTIWDVARSTMGPEDLAVIADGFHLIMPGGRRWASPPPPPGAQPAWTDQWIPFNKPESSEFLFSGWSWWESWGTWSVGQRSTMVLPVPANQRVRVTFRWSSLIPEGGTRLRLGSEVFDVKFPLSHRETRRSFEVQTTSPLLHVAIETPGMTVVPSNQRALAIGMIAARVQLATDPADDEPPAIEPVLDAWMSCAADGPCKAFLQDGWSYPESWGTWTDAEEATLALPVPPGERLAISLRWVATAPAGSRQTGHLSLDDQTFEVAFPPESTVQEQTFEVTSRRRWIATRFVIDRPNVVGGRALGVGLEAVRVHRVAQP